MLGEEVYEAHGKIIGTKYLPNGKFEIEATLQGSIYDERFSANWTGEGQSRKDRTLLIEFQGVITTKSGVTIPYTGIGSGINRDDGSTSYTGGACFSSPPGKFAKLNGISVVYKVEVDDAGFIESRGRELK